MTLAFWRAEPTCDDDFDLFSHLLVDVKKKKQPSIVSNYNDGTQFTPKLCNITKMNVPGMISMCLKLEDFTNVT